MAWVYSPRAMKSMALPVAAARWAASPGRWLRMVKSRRAILHAVGAERYHAMYQARLDQS